MNSSFSKGYSLIELCLAVLLGGVVLAYGSKLVVAEQNHSRLSASQRQTIYGEQVLRQLSRKVVQDYDQHFLKIPPLIFKPDAAVSKMNGANLKLSANPALAAAQNSDLLISFRARSRDLLKKVSSELWCHHFGLAEKAARYTSFGYRIRQQGIELVAVDIISGNYGQECLQLALRPVDNFFTENLPEPLVTAGEVSYFLPVIKFYGFYQDQRGNLRYLSLNNLEITENQKLTHRPQLLTLELLDFAAGKLISLETPTAQVRSQTGKYHYLNLLHF